MRHSAKPYKGLCFALLLCLAFTQHDTSQATADASNTIRDAAQAEAASILDEAEIPGGLILHVGCGDGALTTALRVNDRYLVFGISRKTESVDQARRQVGAAGLGGKVVIDSWNGGHLPCIDNLVNLVIVENSDEVSKDELLRVLCPRGVALVRDGQKWRKTTKSWPGEIDEWTHYLHGPDNNAVAADSRVDAPFHIQWIGGPKWARHHNHLSTTSAMVSARGRLFAIVDEGPTVSLALPPDWKLIARDAFNGVVLWKKKIGPWEGVMRAFRSGPVDLARRLVAVGDRVYVTPGYNKPVVALDAATGETVHSYAETAGAVEFILDAEKLFVVVGRINREEYAASRRRGLPAPPPRNKRLIAIDAATGTVLWEKSGEDSAALLPSTLCAAGGRVFFHSPEELICVNAASGEEVWRSSRKLQMKRLSWSAPTLVVHDDVVLSADRSAQVTTRESSGTTQVEWKVTAGTGDKTGAVGHLIAYSAHDGKELWRCPTALGYNSPPDVLVSDGLVWTGSTPGRNKEDFTKGRDLRTGEVKRQLQTDSLFSVAHHHRCYRNKATERFILLGRTGVELIDLDDGSLLRNCWVRGACQYGLMPANGLVYTPPHSCACYIQSKISGFYALAPKRRPADGEANQSAVEARRRPRLEQGPAYGRIAERQDQRVEQSSEWPTFRHDPGRTGRSTTNVPKDLNLAWRTKVGGRLTSPVIAGGMLLVASVDDHSVHALDSTTGTTIWQRTVGGRVDSPPTIDSELVVFGCADGSVYCLRLDSGELVWRFHAAPTDLRTVAFGQVESVWPVTGSVLVRDGVVHCTAGRSSFLDGGMILCRLNLKTGALIGETRFDDRDPLTGKQREETIQDVELPGALPDVLVDDGRFVYLRDKVLNHDGVEQDRFEPHLYCSAGLLDDNWWHRTSWMWGERNWGRASGWAVMPGIRPSGRILATDDSTVFGYGRKKVKGTTMKGYHLFRAAKKVKELDRRINNNNAALAAQQKPARVFYHWSREVPVVARAMALTDRILFAAGPSMLPEDAGSNEPTFDEKCPAELWAFSTDDGADLARVKLETQPVFDGMALARGKLFMSTVDGNVVCYGAASNTP